MLSFNPAAARQADSVNQIIDHAGKYIGVITRAEALTSKGGTLGLGLSFKADDGATANYLDIYTTRNDGSLLRGFHLVNALLGCLRLRSVNEGTIQFERWDPEARRMEKTSASGYPDLMGKRIGLILQKELATNEKTGEDTKRMVIVSVFEEKTGLTCSEILDGKTMPVDVAKREAWVLANPVYDRRNKPSPAASPAAGSAMNRQPDRNQAFLDDEIPF